MNNTKLFESIFSEAAKARLNEEVIGINKVGIEVNLNGWQVANENFPQGGAPAEFDTEAEAKASSLFNKLVQRYGANKVRTFVQRRVA